MIAFDRTIASSAVVAALLLTGAAAQADGHRHDRGHRNDAVTVYFTRHAEKKTTTRSLGDARDTYELAYTDVDTGAFTVSTDSRDDDGRPDNGTSKGDLLDQVCGTEKCAEELSDLGLERADLLVQYFDRRGVIDELDAVYSSHKRRTFQTVDPTAVAAGLDVVQLPGHASELSPEGTSVSECPTLEAIHAAAPGSTLLVAGHSGTLYDIMGDGNGDCAGLGLLNDDDASSSRFPKDAKGKVRDFGDVWKVVIRNGRARFKNRVNLQPTKLTVVDRAH